MLSEEKKVEIMKLKEQGLNISEISRRTGADWKTVKKIVARSQNHRKEDPGKVPGKKDSQDECELTKLIFKKLNSNERPEQIISEIGHDKLVINLFQEWRKLGGHNSENLRPSDPKIFRSLDMWIESVEKYPDWHNKIAHKFLAGFAWMRMGRCASYKNQGADCAQIEESNPYACLVCLSYRPSNLLTSELNF